MKHDIKQGIQQQKHGKDPMHKVIDSDHSQAPRTDLCPDDVVLDRNSVTSQDSGYQGPNCIDREDISPDYRSRNEK